MRYLLTLSIALVLIGCGGGACDKSQFAGQTFSFSSYTASYDSSCNVTETSTTTGCTASGTYTDNNIGSYAGTITYTLTANTCVAADVGSETCTYSMPGSNVEVTISDCTGFGSSGSGGGSGGSGGPGGSNGGSSGGGGYGNGSCKNATLECSQWVPVGNCSVQSCACYYNSGNGGCDAYYLTSTGAYYWATNCNDFTGAALALENACGGTTPWGY